jgi:hypothetical protein
MNSTAAHTPRHWFVGRLESFEEVRRTVYEGDDFRNKAVAVFKTPEDAHLAAAAPDMLAALKAAEEWLAGWASAEPYTDTIRAAIAKAEGRAS